MPLTITPAETKALKLASDGLEAAKIIVADDWEVRSGRLLRDSEEVFVIRRKKEIRIVQEIVSTISNNLNCIVNSVLIF